MFNGPKVPPSTRISPASKPLTASLKVKVTKVLSPRRNAVSAKDMLTVGAEESLFATISWKLLIRKLLIRAFSFNKAMSSCSFSLIASFSSY